MFASNLAHPQTLTPAQRLVEATQRCDIDRQTLALEVARQCQSLSQLPVDVSSLLEDLMQQRGTVRKICADIQRLADDNGMPILERTCHALLNEHIPSSVAESAQASRDEQRWQQRRRVSGEELEDEDRYIRS